MLDIVSRVLVGLMLIGLGSLFGKLWDLNERIVAIEGNRFTLQDSRALEDRILKGVPPKEVEDKLNNLQAGRQDHETRIRALEKRRQ